VSEQEKKEYEKLKGMAMNGTLTIQEALKYFQLKEKSKRETT